MKSNLMKLVRWVCLRLTFNELASVVVIFQELLSGARDDIDLKPDERPPHYRQFKVDTIPPLPAPAPAEPTPSWKALREEYHQRTGKTIKPVKRRKNSRVPPKGCRCCHCQAPRRFLYVNNGKEASQVRCKICDKTSPIDGRRREVRAPYYCPHCSCALFLWKQRETETIYKCQNHKCPHFLANLKALTKDEIAMREEGKTSQFKLRYQYREYHLDRVDLRTARPTQKTKVDLGRIHKDDRTLGLVLTFTINLGLSSRVTREALKGIFDIKISHQTVINYVNAAAAYLSDFIDQNCPKPKGPAAADETYIIVENRWHYTWFIIDSICRAICGFNLSNNRNAVPALALLYDCFGDPKIQTEETYELIRDGNPSYDNAIMAYNAQAVTEKNKTLISRTVIGLRNLDPESKEYRCFKQLIERLNRTYKYHTRPRAGFKSFEGAVALTVLFVAYYNFMRPHSARDHKPPVELDCLQGVTLMPQAWIKMIHAAAA